MDREPKNMTNNRKGTETMWKKMYIAGILVLTVLVSIGVSNRTESKNSKMSPDDIQSAYRESFKDEKSKDYGAAINALKPVLSEYPDGYTVNLRLGWLNYLNEDYEASIKCYDYALSIIPASLEAKIGSTLPLLALEEYDDVADTLNQVIKVDPLNYTANLRLAYVLRLQKKYDAAIKASNKMLAIYPTDVSFMTELGLSTYAKGEKDAATDIMWNVLVLDPENTTAKEYFSE